MSVIRDTRDLGSYIRRIRKERGFTQAELAELAGVGVVYISQLENGKETAEIGRALKLLQFLSVDLEARDRRSTSDDAIASGAAPYETESSRLPDRPENSYLALPALIGDDGQTHVMSADQAFWHAMRARETAETTGDDA